MRKTRFKRYKIRGKLSNNNKALKTWKKTRRITSFKKLKCQFDYYRNMPSSSSCRETWRHFAAYFISFKLEKTIHYRKHFLRSSGLVARQVSPSPCLQEYFKYIICPDDWNAEWNTCDVFRSFTVVNKPPLSKRADILLMVTYWWRRTRPLNEPRAAKRLTGSTDCLVRIIINRSGTRLGSFEPCFPWYTLWWLMYSCLCCCVYVDFTLLFVTQYGLPYYRMYLLWWGRGIV